MVVEPAPEPVNEPSVPDAGSEYDTTPPTVSIRFPAAISKVEDAETIWVRGTASDSSGVSEILVNGVAAQLSEASINTIQNKAAFFGASSKSSDNSTQTIEWSVEIPVANDIVVTATDSAGNKNENADQATLLSGYIPQSFAIDHESHRLLGFDDFSDDIFEFNLVSGTHRRIPSDNKLRGHELVYVAEENKLYSARFDWLDDETPAITLAAITPETATYQQLASYSPDTSGGDWNQLMMYGMDYLPSNNSIYFNLALWMEDGSNLRSHIVRYDVNLQQFFIIVNGISGDGKAVYGQNLSVTDEGIYLSGKYLMDDGQSWDDALSRLALDGSTYNAISNYDTFMMVTIQITQTLCTMSILMR